MKPKKRLREVVERVVVFLQLLVSGGFCLWTAKAGAVGLPALDKQEAQNYTSLFWFVGTLLLMAAIGVFVNLLLRLKRPVENEAEK